MASGSASDEAARLRELAGYDVLDSQPAPALEALTRLAARLAGTPFGLISFVDERRLWVKAAFGLPGLALPRAGSLCEHVVATGRPFVSPDAAGDARFRGHPLVAAVPGVRFYAGVPLVSARGHAIGALAVLDRAPRPAEREPSEALVRVAEEVMALLEARREHAHRSLEGDPWLSAAVLRTMGEGVVVLDLTGAIRFANAAARRLLGLGADGAIDVGAVDPSWALLREDGTAMPPEELPSEVTDRTGRPCRNVVVGVRRGDGTRRWLSVSSECIAGEGDPSRGVLVTFTDVTELRETSRSLEQANASLLDVTASIPGSLFQYYLGDDGDERFLFVAGRVLELTGVSPEAALADPRAVWRNVHRDDVPRLRAAAERSRAERSTYDVIARFVTGDRTCWAHQCAIPRAIQGGTLWTGVMIDVTREVMQEAALAEREALLRAVYDTAGDGIVTIDARGVIERANPAAARMFRCPDGRLVGQSVLALLAGASAEDEARIRDLVAHAGDPGAPREVIGRRCDGTTFPAELTVSEFQVGDRRRYTGILRDLTARKQLERLVSESELRLRSAVAYDLHDTVGQLLAGGRFLAQSLAHDLPPEGHPRLAQIHEIFSDALDKVRVLTRSLSALDVASSSFPFALQALAEKTAIIYHLTCDADLGAGGEALPAPHCHQAYLLAEEALVQAARNSGCTRIELSFGRAAGWYRLRICDDGRGPVERRPADGIGLTTMRYRARLLGGTLVIRPAERGGTEVVIDWPDPAGAELGSR